MVARRYADYVDWRGGAMVMACETGTAVRRILQAAEDADPAAAPGDTRQLLLEALDSILHGRRLATYVSTPITTGPLYVEWRDGAGRHLEVGDPGYSKALAGIMAQNAESARPLVEQVENEIGMPVIDPTRLGSVPGWEQRDYHEFWLAVVTRYARRVVFADGWNYSSGCALEFAAALRTGSRLLDSSLGPLAASAGIEMLEDGAARIADAGLDATPLQRALTQARATLDTHSPCDSEA